MDESRDEDSQQDQQAPAVNRRDFLGKVAALGGAFVGLAALASAAEAAEFKLPAIRLVPRVNSAQLNQALLKIKNSGAAGPYATAEWAGPVRSLAVTDRIATVAVLEFSQRDPKARDIGGGLGRLFGYLAAGMKAEGVKPGADALGFGCGQGCGTGCLGAMTELSGFMCGGNCGSGCSSEGLAESATGNICGMGCAGLRPRALAVDVQGKAVPAVQLRGLSMAQLSNSLIRAQQAYQQTFH